MKKTLATLIAATICITAFCQDITGTWNGILKVQGMQLRLVFNISKTDNGYSATMDSPDQWAKDIPVTTISYENSKLQLKIDNAGIVYEGITENDSVVGTFKQGGLSAPMNLTRKIAEKQKVLRPQEPSKPYPYYEEEVTFENRQAGITLAGTLTLPKKEGKFPVVVLISGSGPQNR
ncbi:MAG: alpha/beta hydrolase, partial [Paludibacter sp.]|nr:alpha/beta hydrolase [Paludibacter sp.]